MKYVKYLLVVMLSVFSLTNVQAADKEVPVTDTIRVKGNCETCKKIIERAAHVKGVKKAVWSAETHQLIVTYLSSKVSNDKIQQSVANAGYDTEKFRADDKVYHSLHACCQYER